MKSEEVTFNEEAINAGCVSDILCYIEKGDKLMKSVDKITHIGDKKEARSPRPLKVCMRNIRSALLATKHGKLLWQFDTEGYSFDLKRVFISPDRSQEERVARRILVKEMKQKIKDNQSQRYVIKGGKVCVRDE